MPRWLIFDGKRSRSLLFFFSRSLLRRIPSQIDSPCCVPGECVTPVTQRQGEMGCYLLAETKIGHLPANGSYWHIFEYAAPKEAEANKGSTDTIVRSFGRTWLFRISAKRRELAKGGLFVASVGPLPLPSVPTYTARYMETVSMPGMRTAVHRHSGPEAWYLLSGVQCAATDHGSIKAVAGHGALTPANRVMQMVTIGTVKRQALVLVLHDSRVPWTTRMRDTPNLLADCRQ
jgi:quercetin dioxygenase-like cupin family protein